MGEGWETRRRRKPGYEWLVVRLAGHGEINLAEIDTSWFRGNQPDTASLQTLDASTGAALTDENAWHDLLPPVKLLPDTPHRYRVYGAPATHVRLKIFPDGGVARLYVHGEVVPDPALLEGLTVDLAAVENGADIVARSDQFYSSPRNLISPGLSRVMGEGWETRRRRKPGYEWLVVRLAGRGVVHLAEIDTSWYRGNQPDYASLQTIDADPAAGGSLADERAWQDLLPRVRLLPDTPHRFRVDSGPATHVRLNIFPDGGVARLRLYGSLTDDGLAAARQRWDETA